MPPPPLTITKTPGQLIPDDRRVITRLFLPAGETRVRSVLDRVLGLSDEEVSTLLAKVMLDFAQRHRHI